MTKKEAFSNFRHNIYNEEGVLVANDIDTILELLENNGYHVDLSEEEAKKLRIESGVSDE